MKWYRPTLERISHVAFIAMCIVVAAVGLQRLTSTPAGTARARTVPIQPGTKLDLHENLSPGPARASLVLALSTNCQYCTASMPFYGKLAALDVVKDGRLRLGVVSLQTDADMRKYLETHQVSIGPIVPLVDSGIPIRGTPTAVLVDGSGLVISSWAGQLAPAEEDALLRDVRRVVSR